MNFGFFTVLSLILLIGLVLIINYQSKSKEHFQSMTEPGPYKKENTYNRSINELTDVDEVLKRKTEPGKAGINTLELTDGKVSDYPDIITSEKSKDESSKSKDFSEVSPPYHDKTLRCIPKNHPIKKYISKYQPYMLNKPTIVDYYGSQFYNDWRYPLKPISLKFLADPVKYCKLNPSAYPCTVMSKDLYKNYK